MLFFMKIVVNPWTKGADENALAEIAALWNRNAPGRHAFFPWSGKLLARAFSTCGMDAGRLLEAREGSALVGFAHATWMREYGYPPGGAVEALLVDRDARGRGVDNTHAATDPNAGFYVRTGDHALGLPGRWGGRRLRRPCDRL